MTLKWSQEEVKSHLEKWYSVADAMVPPNSVKWFTEDASVQFNGMEPAVGKAAIQNFFQSVVNYLSWQKRKTIHFDVIGTRIYEETQHTLVAKADPEQKEISIHQMNVYDVEPESGLFTKWTAYTERTELFERIKLGEGREMKWP